MYWQYAKADGYQLNPVASLTHETYSVENVLYKPSIPYSEESTIPPKVAASRNPQGYNPCSCVSYAKSLSGFSKSIGYARNWPIDSLVPAGTGTVVLAEGPYGHVANFVQRGDVLLLREANYISCKVTTRTIPITYSRIIGYDND